MSHEWTFTDLQFQLTREVWILTAEHAGQRSGLTATWVSPCSLDPTQPMLLAGLSVTHFTTELVRQSLRFTAHLLHHDQSALAWDFARDSGRQRDKFGEIPLDREAQAAGPVLADCLAWLDCRVLSVQQAGERLYIWADVMQVCRQREGTPLTDRELFGQLTAEQRAFLGKRREADIAAQLPLHQQWRLESMLNLGRSVTNP